MAVGCLLCQGPSVQAVLMPELGITELGPDVTQLASHLLEPAEHLRLLNDPVKCYIS